MRTKHIFKVLALVLCIGAFALPTTAFAAGGKDTVPPSLEASLTDGKVQIEAADDNSGVADYEAMKDMLYGDIPDFEAVMSAVRELEKEINAL